MNRAYTPPKGRSTEHRPSRNIPPTVQRRFHGKDHAPPSGKHADGRERGALWHGTSRVVDRPAKQRANRRTWKSRTVAR